jgi:hypothetical protein
MKPESEVPETVGPVEAATGPDGMEDYPRQPEIPGSSTADVVTLLFMAVMILATVGCFIFLM